MIFKISYCFQIRGTEHRNKEILNSDNLICVAQTFMEADREIAENPCLAMKVEIVIIWTRFKRTVQKDHQLILIMIMTTWKIQVTKLD